MLLRLAREQLGLDDDATRARCIFVGDSPNDQAGFTAFAKSVGVFGLSMGAAVTVSAMPKHPDLRCAAVDHFHGAEYSSGTTGRSGADAAGQVYRALFIRVSPGTPQDVLEEFERDLLRMPTHISSICAWRVLTSSWNGTGSIR